MRLKSYRFGEDIPEKAIKLHCSKSGALLRGKTNPDEITRIADYTSSLVEGGDYGTDFAHLCSEAWQLYRLLYTVTDGNDYEEVAENDEELTPTNGMQRF